MARTTTSEMWGRATYLDRDAGLPDMGASGLGPRPLTRRDVDLIHACDDPRALAELAAYAHSYFAIGGSVIAGTVTTIATALAGRRRIAIGAVIATGVCVTVVMEARRRARQWQAVAEARLATRGGPPVA